MNGLEKNLFQLQVGQTCKRRMTHQSLLFTAKQLNKQSKRCQKDELAEKAKLKKAIQDGNKEGARIYASNAIRKKNEALNLLRLSSQIQPQPSDMLGKAAAAAKQKDRGEDTLLTERLRALRQ